MPSSSDAPTSSDTRDRAALSVCANCQLAGTCRIAASLNRLARVRDKLPEGGVHSWLHDRIDDYLDVPVCLAGVFRIGAPHMAPPPPERPGRSWPDVLEMAVHRHQATRDDDSCAPLPQGAA